MKKRVCTALLCFFCLYLQAVSLVHAQGQVLGIHILSPGDVDAAGKLLATPDNATHSVTVPLSFADLDHPKDWQTFFDHAAEEHLSPIIRLTTRFENGSWVVPNRADIMRFASFLTALDWHEDALTIILFNEPNHAAEWGGHVDAVSYASILQFGIDWFKTEPKNYTVLPAGLDLAANNSADTTEAFTFLASVIANDPQMLSTIDGWTSHSYPNPGFSSSPLKSDKSSLRGYQYELAFLAKYTNRQLPVYITETGWNNDALRNWQLKSYYQIAYNTIWKNDPRIQVVTPFLLQGAPGTFAPFSFLDANGKPNLAYDVYRQLLGEKN